MRPVRSGVGDETNPGYRSSRSMSDLVVSQAPSAEVTPARGTSRTVYDRTFGVLFRALARAEHFADGSSVSQTAGARNVRRAIALLFGLYATLLEGQGLLHGDLPTVPIFVFMAATALFIGRGGRFVYYLVPVFLGLVSYNLAGRAVDGLKLPVHYLPQIKLEQWLTPGPLPTIWLQEHLYHGTTGVLEVFALAMYISHFWVALAVGFGLAIAGRGRAFATLMFGILAVSILGEITFILAPTAPPWLAAQDGFLPPVHHILKSSLYDVHLTQVASLVGDSSRYDVTAAVPSLHVAFPVLCLLTVIAHRLPRWLAIALALNILGVVFAIVYTGDHYLVDALAGVVYALAAWWLVRRLLGREVDLARR